MSEYLDAMNESEQSLTDARYELAGLSRAFYHTGNPHMGDQLGELSILIQTAAENISDAVGKELHVECVRAQQSSFNTLAACLAMNGTDVPNS